MTALDVESARRRFWADGPGAAAGSVRAEVLASWERSAGVDVRAVGAPFIGHDAAAPGVADAGDVFEEFHRRNPDAGCSLALVDADGVVRVRRDGGRALAEVLDAVRFVPGYRYDETAMGTTAAAIALHTGSDARVDGAEHLHADLTWLAEAAALVPDGAVVVVLTHVTAPHPGLVVARLLADQVAERVASRRHRVARSVHDGFADACGAGAEWVVATDGDFVLTNAGVRKIAADDQQVLADLALAGAVLPDGHGSRHVDLPSGHCAEVGVTALRLDGSTVGCVLAGGLAAARQAGAVPDALRRQGSHVASTARRDYAADLHGPSSAERAHAEARARANRELLSPYLRARQEVATSVGQRRHHLLMGEAGVGKRTLAVEQFRRTFPTGTLRSLDCSGVSDSASAPDPLAQVTRDLDDQPRMLVLRQMNLLSPVAARRLDESLRTLVAMPSALIVVGCVDTVSADATRPYGLLLRHFHETVRVPALRYRADELGEIALSILRSLTGGRSLRLSLQVIRVLEGYAWPGNVRELEDVLRYVIARKPVGVIQAPDLPASCFAARAPKLSMLESAQCDAIIQALYESGGNRYKAAAMLGIARSSLYRKIDAFGISYIA